MIRILAPLAIFAALAACSSPDEMSEAVAVNPDGESVEDRLARRIGAGGEPVEFKDEEERDGSVRDFNYSWPAQVSAIPELAAQLGRMRDRALAEQKAEWESALEEFAGEDCATCTNRGWGTTWQVVADTPRFLSLSAESYLYSGGAHGNSNFDAMVWDRELGDALETRAFFTAPEGLALVIAEPYCRALNELRAERRGGMGAGGDLGECPQLNELTLLIGSSNGETFDRLGLIAAPYIAGSYAEGPYEVTIPLTRDMLAEVKPAYREHFTVQ